MLTKEDILALRPKFTLPGGMAMVDWFIITSDESYCCIRSGLEHADGTTKSPFYFNRSVVSNSAEADMIREFNKWWEVVSLRDTELVVDTQVLVKLVEIVPSVADVSYNELVGWLTDRPNYYGLGQYTAKFKEIAVTFKICDSGDSCE